VNWKANNSKISRVCNNPYTNALTTNAHVSVAVYVSRQPTCLVYVFRVAVRETYKSCGCYVVLYVYGCKDSANRVKYQRNIFFSLYFRDAAYLRDICLKDNGNLSRIQNFCYLFKDSYHFLGLKGLTSLLFYANSLIIRFFFVSLPPRINNFSYGSNRFQSIADSSASNVRPGQESKWAQGVEGRTLPPLFG